MTWTSSESGSFLSFAEVFGVVMVLEIRLDEVLEMERVWVGCWQNEPQGTLEINMYVLEC